MARSIDPARLKRAVDAELCRRSLAEFIRQAWHVVEPGTPLEWGWHLDALCVHLEAVTRGDILRLIINIGPGHCKSLVVSVFWPAWEWIERPHIRSLYGSHDQQLAARDAVRTRDLITSKWYRDTFTPFWRLKRDQNAKSFFINDQQGLRWTFGMGGRVTGWRGDKVVVDDPLDAKNQFNRAVKDDCLFVWNNKLSSRVNDPRKARFVLIMQRLSSDDLAGRLLEIGGYEHLCLPSEFDPARRSSTSIGWTDPRTEPGELLFPKFFTKDVLDNLRVNVLGSDGYAGQYQQIPTSAEGSRFHRAWFTRRTWRWDDAITGALRLYRDGERAELVLLANCSIFCSVDVAVGEKRTNDYTCYAVWAVLPSGEMAMLDEVWERMSEPDSIARAKSLKVTWPMMTHYVVEKNGVGFPLVQQMQAAGLPVLPIDVSTDKMVMSTSAVVMAEAGRIFIPDPEGHPWVTRWLEEISLFPGGSHDDRVSALSLAAEQVFTGAVAIPGAPIRVERDSPGLHTSRGGSRVRYDRDDRDMRWDRR